MFREGEAELPKLVKTWVREVDDRLLGWRFDESGTGNAGIESDREDASRMLGIKRSHSGSKKSVDGVWLGRLRTRLVIGAVMYCALDFRIET